MEEAENALQESRFNFVIVCATDQSESYKIKKVKRKHQHKTGSVVVDYR